MWFRHLGYAPDTPVTELGPDDRRGRRASRVHCCGRRVRAGVAGWPDRSRTDPEGGVGVKPRACDTSNGLTAGRSPPGVFFTASSALELELKPALGKVGPPDAWLNAAREAGSLETP